MFTIILNSGYELKNVKPRDSNKSLVGLFIWSVNQRHDVIITTDVGVFRSSQVAAILEEELNGDINLPSGMDEPYNYMDKESNQREEF